MLNCFDSGGGQALFPFMKQHQKIITLKTAGRGLTEITHRIESAVAEAQIRTGLCVVFCCHTSASLMIQENADPSVQTDLLAWLKQLAPDGAPEYKHRSEGPDDMAAHLRTLLTKTSESIPVADGKLTLGTWQGIYLAEHRTSPHTRKIVIHVMGS